MSKKEMRKKVTYEFVTDVFRVVDGDTVEVMIELGFGHLSKRKIRIIAKSSKGFNTYETYRPEDEIERFLGEKATARAKELLSGQVIILRSVKWGKYRYVATIELEDGRDYGDIMIQEGHQKKVRKTSEKWLSEIPEEYGIILSDPDGWGRVNYEHSFYEELITEEEFKRRLMDSTCMCKPGGFDKYMKSDNA